MSTLADTMKDVGERVEAFMRVHTDALYRDSAFAAHPDYVEPVFDAFCYSVFAGGKRLRPFLVSQFCALCGGKESDALSYAAAIEMIHTFSLIHDDLPCMDDDDLRRGKPTNHKVYGEATALLAGDALSLYAFEALCDNTLSAAQNLRAVKALASCAGIRGMIAGQQIDMTAEEKGANEDVLVLLQKKKTGALFEAACVLGCIAAGVPEGDARIAHAKDFAAHLGLAFQITDDILDVLGDTSTLGKTVGSDERDGKSTFVTLLGTEGARARAKEEIEAAKAALAGAFDGDMASLIALCDYILTRNT